MQYENKFRKNVFGFQKAFFQKVHLEKGGSSYIWVNAVII